jgi:hypothetical protein
MIKDDYREETNRDVYDNSERGTYCDDYVRWLENKLQLMQTAVVGQSEQFNCDGCRWFNSCGLRIDYNNVRCEDFDNN